MHGMSCMKKKENIPRFETFSDNRVGTKIDCEILIGRVGYDVRGELLGAQEGYFNKGGNGGGSLCLQRIIEKRHMVMSQQACEVSATQCCEGECSAGTGG